MAQSPDSIDFLARYKNWSAASSLEIGSSTTPREIASYLVSIREEVAEKAFEVLGIETKLLDSCSASITKDLKKNDYSSIPAVYKALGSQQAEQSINAASSAREELRPFAKAYIFRSALRRLGLQWYLSKDSAAQIAQPKKASQIAQPQSEGISFMAKYGEWISVKKLSISGATKPEEVSAHLSSIRLATDRKAPQVLGVDTEALDEYASQITGTMRKSAANIEKIVQALCSADTKGRIDAAAQDRSIRAAAVVYLFARMLQNIKVDLEVSPDTLMDMFPGLKIPKPKGRMPGKKKKKQ